MKILFFLHITNSIHEIGQLLKYCQNNTTYLLYMIGKNILNIQWMVLFKDHIAYTRRYFIRFLSQYVNSCYWFSTVGAQNKPLFSLQLCMTGFCLLFSLFSGFFWNVVVTFYIKNTLLLAIYWILLQKN